MNKLTTPQLLQALRLKVTRANAERITKIQTIEGKYNLVWMRANNPTSKRGEWTYLYIIDKDGVVVNGFDRYGHAQWSQRYLNGKIIDKKVVADKGWASTADKIQEFTKMVTKGFGIGVVARVQDSSIESWTAEELGAVDYDLA